MVLSGCFKEQARPALFIQVDGHDASGLMCWRGALRLAPPSLALLDLPAIDMALDGHSFKEFVPCLSIEALRRRLTACMNLDARRLSSRLHGVKKLPEAKQAAVLETIAADLDVPRRAISPVWRACLRVTYPDNPASQPEAGEIAKAIEEHQVVIIAGETGSGKTTQIPKICLALGRGVRASSATPSRAVWRPVPSRPVLPRRWSPSLPLRGLQGALLPIR